MCEDATDTIAALVHTADGLLVPSESPQPFTAFRWGGEEPLTPAALLARLGLPPETLVEVLDLDTFFAPLTRTADWMSETQRERTTRFAALHDQIAASLADVAVYRVGRIEVKVIIAGRTPEGETGGLHTTLIET